MNLYMIRHGISNANENKLVTGDTNDSLSSRGIEEAQKAAKNYKSIKLNFSACYTSQWKRAQDTAKILFPKKKFVEESRIGETFAGNASSKYLDEFLIENPLFYKNNNNKYPNGESHNDLYRRVISWLNEIYKIYKDKNVLVITHSGPIRCFIIHALNISMESFSIITPINLSSTLIQYKSNNSILEGRLITLSNISLESIAGLLKNEKNS
jgi:broad specificity phosphatase PhoE